MHPEKKKTITRYFLQEGTTVILIVNGYRWDCPQCGEAGYIPSAHQAVTCPGCSLVFRVLEVRHWSGKQACLPGTSPSRLFKPAISKFKTEEDQRLGERALLHDAAGETVLTASGYAWRCPECDTVNFSPEISFEPANCTHCRSNFSVSEARHRTSTGDLGLRVTPGAIWLKQQEAVSEELPEERNFSTPPTKSFVG